MARVFGSAQVDEGAWELLPSEAGASTFRLLTPCTVPFDQASGGGLGSQTLAPYTFFTTIDTPQTPGGFHTFSQASGVWLALVIAGDSVGHLALEAELSLLDPIILLNYAALRRILWGGSLPFQQA